MAKVNLNNDIVGVLDIGSTKVCCLIVSVDIGDKPVLLGIGHQLSSGISKGQVTNIPGLESAIRGAVSDAEEMASVRLDKIFINISCSNLQSHKAEAEMNIFSNPIDEEDVVRVMEEVNNKININDRDVIHCITTGYSINGSNGISDPRGMFGDSLGVHFNLMSSSISQSRNLDAVLERCHLEIENKVVSSYASGLSCLVEDEKKLGAILIDMGGGVTSISVFRGGHIEFIGIIPLGGDNVTKDIAIGLSTSIADAEKFKIKYGSVSPNPNDSYEHIKVPLVGEEEDINFFEIQKSTLVEIIRPRIEDIFIEIKYMLEKCGYGSNSFKRVVITGGASQLGSIKIFAENQLSRKVRMARPNPIVDLPDSISGPAFSTVTGLLYFALNEKYKNKDKREIQSINKKYFFTKMGEWLKQNF